MTTPAKKKTRESPKKLITVNQSIPKYWNKKEKESVKLLIVTEYKFGKSRKTKFTAPAVIRPHRMKLSHLNQLTKIIALYGSSR